MARRFLSSFFRPLSISASHLRLSPSHLFILSDLKRSYCTIDPPMEVDTTDKRPKTVNTYGTAKNGATMKIVLTENESRICDLLQKVSDYIAAQRPDLPRIESRIAGGWVRDKVTTYQSGKKSPFLIRFVFWACSFWGRSAMTWISP